MSDRELVTIEAHQFALLHAALEAIGSSIRALGNHQEILAAINNLDRKVDNFMATQEERLQAISTKIDEVLADLATLKTNNPQIEDEIEAIEAKLSIAQPTVGDTGAGG